ncbi:Homeodomain-like protein [Cynara cardunculus var. scolymus]|uniref:Homeodomain-like protein n=1 Tax=Cynara cardunculus var. scolymus TaxID=59895 RepID=A0A103Y8S8_CYNCS|nr:Homeodomain-like protein [Cynara cardunculus var. scolymus]
MSYHDEEESSGSDSDTGFAEDMEALRRACSVTGVDDAVDDLPKSSTADDDHDDATYASEDEDIELLRRIQQRFSVPTTDVGNEQQPVSMRPLNTILPSGLSEENDDYGDDFETLRAIQRRFSQYNDSMNNSMESSLQSSEQVGATNIDLEKESSTNFFVKSINNGQGFPDCVDGRATDQNLDFPSNITPDILHENVSEGHEPGSELVPVTDCGFPRSAQAFVEAIKKNRTCQKFIRSKLVQIEARMEENKKLRERVKILKDFQVACRKRTGRALSQKKDARIQLISVPKQRANAKIDLQKRQTICFALSSPSILPSSSYWLRKELGGEKRTCEDWSNHGGGGNGGGGGSQGVSPNEALPCTLGKDKNTHAIYQGPAENSHVAIYRDVISKYPFSLNREPWLKEDKENLMKGIKQQFQETLMHNLFSAGDVDSRYLDSMIAKIGDHEISPEEIRLFVPRVNWEHLSSMYVQGRSGPECESRWMNCEDPLINRQSWTVQEDKKLLYVVQNEGFSNWIDIAGLLGTNRTPFQCLSRFQRSLNASIIKNEWTTPEDEELRIAVSEYGETNWQLVASTLEGRTGTQCSNRWKKSLNPLRERVGKWAPDEDKRLKIAVRLFGAKNWYKIARFVPGRTQVQCRERWVNCLDPSLNMNEWTEEEDLKLKEAIAEHGYSWSKIAACIPPRTDSQCRRRWKVLLPHEVPMLQAARKMKKAALISNFVDREEERPALTASDFIPPPLLIKSAPKVNEARLSTKNKRQRLPPEHHVHDTSSGTVVVVRSRRARKVTHTEKVLRLTDVEDNADVTDNGRWKNKPTSLKNKSSILVRGTELHNGEGNRASVGDNAEMKGEVAGKQKRKRRYGFTFSVAKCVYVETCVLVKSTDKEDGEILEADAISKENTMRRANEGCELAESEVDDVSYDPCLLEVLANEPCSCREMIESTSGKVEKTYKRSRKRANVDGDKRSSVVRKEGSEILVDEEAEDGETLASFYKKVKKRRLEGR